MITISDIISDDTARRIDSPEGKNAQLKSSGDNVSINAGLSFRAIAATFAGPFAGLIMSASSFYQSSNSGNSSKNETSTLDNCAKPNDDSHTQMIADDSAKNNKIEPERGGGGMIAQLEDRISGAVRFLNSQDFIEIDLSLKPDGKVLAAKVVDLQKSAIALTDNLLDTALKAAEKRVSLY